MGGGTTKSTGKACLERPMPKADLVRVLDKTSCSSCCLTLFLDSLALAQEKLLPQVKLMGLGVPSNLHLRPSGVYPPCLSVPIEDR